jgi:hypothetical protein
VRNTRGPLKPLNARFCKGKTSIVLFATPLLLLGIKDPEGDEKGELPPMSGPKVEPGLVAAELCWGESEELTRPFVDSALGPKVSVEPRSVTGLVDMFVKL